MPTLDTLIAPTFYLMTRHSQSPKAGLEQSIVDHIRMLASHSDCDSEVLRNAGERLSMFWRQEARIKGLGIDTKPSYRMSD